MKNICIYNNNDPESLKTKDNLIHLLELGRIRVQENFCDETDLVIVIGGDGTFLNAVKATDYSDTPILGINTGHLGFFADFTPGNLDDVVDVCTTENFVFQHHRTIKADIETGSGKPESCYAVNDVFIKHRQKSLTHLDVYLGDSFVESFSGDGILISTPAGSTAYNYSLGGAIVAPQLDLLQITPVAPQNNSAYRCFTSSLLSPAKEKVNIVPKEKDNVILVFDGNEQTSDIISKISVSLSDKEIRIVRRKDYNFWGKVKSKFL